MRVRYLALVLSCLSLLATPSHAFDQWQQPTKAELEMTEDPAAPGAAAVFLYREETSDDKLHVHSLYVRIKILTEKGKSEADVEIPYDGGTFTITNVEGRTIHKDGSIIPFSGAPYEKLIAKSDTFKYSAKVFSMPAVEVGSIIEYRYKIRYDDNIVSTPRWVIQQPYYLHKGHYKFTPVQSYMIVQTEHGNINNALLYWPNLPKGQEVKYIRDHYELDVHDIPAEPHESFMPPLHSFTYRVFFYYSSYTSGEEFWKSEGKHWNKKVEHFASSGPVLKEAVTQLTTGADTTEKKIQKIYAAIMGMENTDYTRAKSEQEKKALHQKEPKNVEDVWKLKSGDSQDLAILFLSMLRAAGIKSYAMQVVNRDTDIFNPSFLSTSQLDDFIVIAVVDGKEVWFDPGSKLCPYGKLQWKHTWARGLRQNDQGATLANSIGTGYPDNQTKRTASLTLDENGDLKGIVRISMTGAEALKWRQKILRTDEENAKHEFEEELNSQLPDGLKAEVRSILGKDEFATILMVVVNIQGNIATKTATRMLLPIEIFEAKHRSPFVDQTNRQSDIDLRYPSVLQDQISIHLPEGWAVESRPQTETVPFADNARLIINSGEENKTVSLSRMLALANTVFPSKDYSAIRAFYDKVSELDQQQLVLKRVQENKGQ